MEARADLALRIGFLAASSLVLFGCPNPNTYTTPRTIGSGHLQGSAAVETWGFYIPTTSASYAPAERSAIYLVPPTFTLRLGLGASWEIAARASNMSSLGGDIKWNFLKSSGIDLAIDPAYQIYQISETDGSGTNQTQTFSYLNVPLLVGVNLSRTVSLVFTPGATWGFASSGKIRFTNGSDQGSAPPAPSGVSESASTSDHAGLRTPPRDHVLARLRRRERDRLHRRAWLQLRRHAQLRRRPRGSARPRRRRPGIPHRRQSARPARTNRRRPSRRFPRQCRDPIGNRTRPPNHLAHRTETFLKGGTFTVRRAADDVAVFSAALDSAVADATPSGCSGAPWPRSPATPNGSRRCARRSASCWPRRTERARPRARRRSVPADAAVLHVEGHDAVQRLRRNAAVRRV